jgi:hypothetical protein
MASTIPIPFRVARSRVLRARSRRRLVLAALLGFLISVGAIVLYREVTRDRFTGIRVVAPNDKCWRGTVSSGTLTNVSGCGPEQLPVECRNNGTVLVIDKISPGNWTLTVTAFQDGAYRQSGSSAYDYGRVGFYQSC